MRGRGSDADGEKNQHDEQGALQERKSECGTQKRCGARRRQNGGKNTVEKRACCAMLRGEVARRIERASAERDFKNTEQIQRDQRNERDEADNENGAAKLHSPTGVMTRRLDADDDGRKHEKRK